jgi:hypothetical protein
LGCDAGVSQTSGAKLERDWNGTDEENVQKNGHRHLEKIDEIQCIKSTGKYYRNDKLGNYICPYNKNGLYKSFTSFINKQLKLSTSELNAFQPIVLS